MATLSQLITGGLREALRKGLDQPIQPVSTVYRFWIPVGQAKKIIFLDDANEVPSGYEHEVLSDNRYYALCLKNFTNKCPLCDRNIKRYYVSYFTVIDIDGYTAKDGTVRNYIKKAYVMKSKARDIFRNVIRVKSEVAGVNFSTKFAMFVVSRAAANSPSTGDVFDYVRHFTLDEMNKMVEEGKIDSIDPIPVEKMVNFINNPDDLLSWYESIAIEIDAETEEESEEDVQQNEVKDVQHLYKGKIPF